MPRFLPLPLSCLAGAAAAAVLLFSSAATHNAPREPRPADRRPNILVYMIDTLRADELGCYGAKTTSTPNFDRFASESALFENCSSLAAGTRPSVASFITGVSGDVHDAWGGDYVPLPSGLARLPDLLRKAGYSTFGVVANPNVARIFGFAEGYDVYHELYADPGDAVKDGERMGRLNAPANVVVDKIIETIDAAPADRPFFLYALSIDPHSPYSPPAPFEKMYHPDADGQRDGSLKTFDALKKDARAGKNPDIARLHALYRGEVSYADEQFARLLDWLRKTNRLDDTLIVITSDHGEEFLEHSSLGHGNTLYEELTHVPMILRHPASFKPGERRAEPIDTLDLSSTLLAVGGADQPSYWFGRDLRKPLPPRTIFSSHRKSPPPKSLSAARHDGYKLLRDNARGKADYYYLPDDPREQSPLEGDKRKTAEALLNKRLAQYQRVNSELKGQLTRGTPEIDEASVSADVKNALITLGYVGDDDSDAQPASRPSTTSTGP